MLVELRELGVHDVLRGAAAILEDRGATKEMHEDPTTGEVDVEGALMLACGAKELGILVAYVDDVVPEARLALFDAAIDYLDAAAPKDTVSDWNDDPETTQAQLVEFLLSSASEIAGAVA